MSPILKKLLKRGQKFVFNDVQSMYIWSNFYILDRVVLSSNSGCKRDGLGWFGLVMDVYGFKSNLRPIFNTG